MTRSNEESKSIGFDASATASYRIRGPLSISNLAVITMESSRVLSDQTLIIEGGFIRALGPSSAIDVAGTQAIDGSGRYLMPGLADMHTHITDAGVLRLYLANGVTQVRNMEGLPFHLALSGMVERGELAGPRIYTVSPLIDGLGSQGLTARPRSLALVDPAQAEPLAQRLVARGYREMKAYQWLTLDALNALGSAAASVGVRMAGHCPDGITFEQAIAAGMGSFEHLTGIATGHLRDGQAYPTLRDAASRLGNREALELVAHHLDFDSIRRLAHSMAAADIWNCPTLVVWQKQNQALDVAMADPDLTYEHPGTVRVWEKLLRTRYAALPCSEQEWLALSRGRDKSLAKVVAIFNEEGSPLLLGTDAPNPFVVHGCAIHQELENLVEAGLSPYEALRCGTVEAARFLGESNVSGTVAVGKRADLLLLRENPFADVGSMRKLDAVFVNGLYLTRADLDEMLEQHIGSLSERPRLELPGFEHTLNTGTARENTLEEWFSEIPVGLVTYRHVLLPSGGWQVDERSVRSGPRGREERTSRLWLASDWTLRRAEIESVTNVGCENNEIVWSDDGVFRVRVTQPDGYSTNSTVTSAPVLPSERLAVSVLPEWLALQSARTEASLLDIQHEAVQFAVLSAEPSLPNETGQSTEESVNWEVCITRPGETSSQMYRLSGDGKLLGLRDTLFGGPRELVSENLRGDRAAPP